MEGTEMIHIDYNTTKNLTFYLQPSLSVPIYLVSLVNYTNRTRKSFIAPDVSTALSQLLQLTVTEVGTGAENSLTGRVSIDPPGRYTIEVYEQTSTTNLIIANATLLGSDILMMHRDPVYDNPPLRYPIVEDIAGPDYNNDYNNDYKIT
jgi:hypothetical protein